VILGRSNNSNFLHGAGILSIHLRGRTNGIAAIGTSAQGLRFDTLRICRASIRSEPKDRRRSLCVVAEFADSCFLRPRFPDAGDGKSALSQFATMKSIDPVVLRLPVQPARANYYEVGITKSLFWEFAAGCKCVPPAIFTIIRTTKPLLDTGVSFPIAFAKARMWGEEMRISVPHWGRFSGFLSYANQSGIGQGPITGGLFLGDKATGGLTDTSKFAVSQDQRNTVRARVRYQLPSATAGFQRRVRERVTNGDR